MPMSCLLERGFSAERLDELFDRHAQEQYTRDLLFSCFKSKDIGLSFGDSANALSVLQGNEVGT